MTAIFRLRLNDDHAPWLLTFALFAVLAGVTHDCHLAGSSAACTGLAGLALLRLVVKYAVD